MEYKLKTDFSIYEEKNYTELCMEKIKMDIARYTIEGSRVTKGNKKKCNKRINVNSKKVKILLKANYLPSYSQGLSLKEY